MQTNPFSVLSAQSVFTHSAIWLLRTAFTQSPDGFGCLEKDGFYLSIYSKTSQMGPRVVHLSLKYMAKSPQAKGVEKPFLEFCICILLNSIDINN